MAGIVTVFMNGRETVVTAYDGELLSDVLLRAGVHTAQPCGGRGICGKCLVRGEGGIRKLKEAPEGYYLACKSVVEGDAKVWFGEEKTKIVSSSIFAFDETNKENGLALAVDIGTTTIAAYLIDLTNGETMLVETALNPQRAHGADVISRISFALEDGNTDILKNEIQTALDNMERSLLSRADRKSEEIIRRVLVGNTAMTHMACGYSVLGISKAPFSPKYYGAHMVPWNGSDALIGGCISGYVGSDTISALLACGLDKREECALMIDIGTNGEIALVKDGEILTCSCAAGPAFEGAHIACGTGAVNGAINTARIDNGKMSFTTIGDKEPIGICGSGLIDLVAELFENEEITPAGRMAQDYPLTENVYLARGDVREVQLAKAAIAAGIRILMNEMHAEYDDIDKVYLAGGFGSFINIENACKIGMLPEELKERIVPVGNAAGAGAGMMAMSAEMRKRSEDIRMNARYVELAAHEDFPDLFAENLIIGTEE